ncbi:unnamed protein product, partial [Brassica rapa]
MRKSFQLLFTFLTMFIILSLGMMADGQGHRILFCTYNVPVDTKKSCDPLCKSLCVKVYMDLMVEVFARGRLRGLVNAGLFASV